MADDPSKKADPPIKADEAVALTEKLTAAEVVLQQKEGVIRELTLSNENMLEELKAFRTNPSMELAQKEIDKLKRGNLAEKVRRVTTRMRADNQIDRAALQGWYDHDSDEVVLAGFKNSQFKGNLDLLQYHRDSIPKRPGDRRFISGEPIEEGTVYTADQKKHIRDLGKDAELLEATRGAKNFTEYKQLKAAAKKG